MKREVTKFLIVRYVYHTLSDIESVSPATGSENGGQLITITGSGFDKADTVVKVGAVSQGHGEDLILLLQLFNSHQLHRLIAIKRCNLLKVAILTLSYTIKQKPSNCTFTIFKVEAYLSFFYNCCKFIVKVAY